MRESSEAEFTNLLVFAEQVQESKHKQANWQAQKLLLRAETSPTARRDRGHLPQKFGDACTVDQKVLCEETESRLQHRHPVVMQD